MILKTITLDDLDDLVLKLVDNNARTTTDRKTSPNEMRDGTMYYVSRARYSADFSILLLDYSFVLLHEGSYYKLDMAVEEYPAFSHQLYFLRRNKCTFLQAIRQIML